MSTTNDFAGKVFAIFGAFAMTATVFAMTATLFANPNATTVISTLA